MRKRALTGKVNALSLSIVHSLGHELSLIICDNDYTENGYLIAS